MDDLLSTYGPGFGIGAFIIALLAAVVRGDFIPRKSHEAMIKLKDEQIADLKAQQLEAIANVREQRDDWKTAYRTLAEAHEVGAGTIPAIGEYVKTTNAVITALSRVVHPEVGELNGPSADLPPPH